MLHNTHISQNVGQSNIFFDIAKDLTSFLQKTFVYSLNIGLLSFFFRTFALDFSAILCFFGSFNHKFNSTKKQKKHKYLIFNWKKVKYRIRNKEQR